ncbi:MAG: flagellar hook-associated protein FlgK [Sporolactobacillus sp.]|nr:flagellar hook-associated protein FlgK [Sporolactobacillus sp.]
MIPIFSSLNMMQRSLEVTQAAIQTTGHNISNANTEGYSRQRVNLSAWLPYPAIGINAAGGAGQIGTGVIDDSIVRIRDQFVDTQVRDNSAQNGYWSSVDDAYSQMQDIINEPTDTGISEVLDNFWQSLQDLAGNSGTSGTGAVVLQDGKAVADTFNYLSQSLGKVQDNLESQINENVNQINNYADQINELNKEIATQEANGLLPNDLYDERDALTDKLSELANIKVTKVPSGGNPSKLAEGKYTIELVKDDGSSYEPNATLVDGDNLTNHYIKAEVTDDGTTAPVVKVGLVDSQDDNLDPDGPLLTDSSTADSSKFSGKLQGLIDAYTTDYPEVLASLDHLASTLAKKFNSVYSETAGGYQNSKGTFFIGDSTDPAHSGTVTAANIHVNEDLTGSDVTASEEGAPTGDNTGAQNLADVIASNAYDVDTDGNQMTLKNYLESLIGQIGVNAQSAEQFTKNTNALLEAAQNRQQSISGVSMDEELTNLIQFQHSYAASAKVVTTLDTMLDTIINKMG